MNRRSLLAGILAAPLAGRALAQEPGRVRVVGYLIQGDGYPRGFSARMRELGYVEGRNLRLEIRRVPPVATAAQIDHAAADLVASGADVIVAAGAANVAALHRATSKIPIVSGGVSDPVSIGVARSLRNPGMNVTGLSYGLEEGAVLQFGALRILRPRLGRVVFMVGANDPDPRVTPEHASAARTIGIGTDVALIGSLEDVERVFGAIRDARTEAAWVAPLAAFASMKQVAASAIRHRVATHGMGLPAVRDGLLISYWPQQSDALLRIAGIVDKILRGADPAKIPFELPDRTELILNRATAAAIGVQIPEELRLRATQIVG